MPNVKTKKSVSFASVKGKALGAYDDSSDSESVSDSSLSSVSFDGSDEGNLGDSALSQKGGDLFWQIRKNESSRLENQKHLATTLHALESSLVEQNILKFTPLAYFTSILSILEQEDVAESSRVEAVASLVHLFQIVVPEISSMVLTRHYLRVSLVLMSISENFADCAPIVKSNLLSFRHLLVAQSLACWKAASTASRAATDESAGLCKAMFMHMVKCAVEHGPKVRRIARDALVHILHKPPSPSLKHPANLWIADYVLSALEALCSSSNDLNSAPAPQLFHILALLRAVNPILHRQLDSNLAGKLRRIIGYLLNLVNQSTSTHVQVAAIEAVRVFFYPEGSSLNLENLCDENERTLRRNRDEVDGKVASFIATLDAKWVDYVLREILELLVNFTDHEGKYIDPVVFKLWVKTVEDGVTALGFLVTDWENESDRSKSQKVEVVKAAESFHSLQLQIWELLLLKLEPVDAQTKEPVFTLFTRMCSSAVLSKKQIQNVKLVSSLASLLWKAFESIGWSGCRPSLTLVFHSLLERVRKGVWLGEIGANQYVGIFSKVMLSFVSLKETQSAKKFQEIDVEFQQLFQSAISAFGLSTFLSVVPLNFDGKGELAPRPWLLPLIKASLESDTECLLLKRPSEEASLATSCTRLSSIATAVVDARLERRDREAVVTPHSLSHFFEFWVPTALMCFEKARRSCQDGKKREMEAKLYETLGVQIFEILPSLCAASPFDVASSAAQFTQFWQGVLSTGYCESFDLLKLPSGKQVVNNLIAKIGCDASIELLMSQYSLLETCPDFVETNWLALKQVSNEFLGTLCSAFSKQYSLLESLKYTSCILAWLHAADPQVVTNYFATLLESMLQRGDIKSKNAAPTLDLLISLIPFIEIDWNCPKNSVAIVFLKYLSGLLEQTVSNLDPIMQKRVYKGITSVLNKFDYELRNESEQGRDVDLPNLLDVDALLRSMTATGKKAASGIKKQRFLCLQAIVELVPFSQRDLLLQIVPQVLPEVILGTKVSGSKARLAAFSVLCKLGYRMLHLSQQAASGGNGEINESTIELKSLEQALEEKDSDMRKVLEERRQRITLQEYVTMVAAGVCDLGDTSLVAATLSCLGCLLYEFQAVLPRPFLSELLQDVLLKFLTNRNMEIAKATLGAVKVAVVQLDKALLRENLNVLLKNLFLCHHQHNGRFKLKVRHLIERLLRLFSAHDVLESTPEEDRSWVELIKKEKEKAGKNRKTSGATPMAEVDNTGLLDELLPSNGNRKRPGAAFSKPLIVESLRLDSSKNVDDLLDSRFASQIVSSNVVSSAARASMKRKRSEQASEENDEDGVNIDRTSGKVLVSEVVDAKSNGEVNSKSTNEDVSMYMEAINGEDSFRKTLSGRVKFGNVAKTASDSIEGDDEDELEETLTDRKLRLAQKKQLQLQKQREAVMLGSRFKSNKAGGDVKRKGQPQPYAYIPLQSKIVGNKKKSTKSTGQFAKLASAATSSKKRRR